MQKFAVNAAILVSLFSLILVSSESFADLCVLKTGDYTLSSKYTLANPSGFTADGSAETATPCTSAAGGGDIALDFSVGSDIEIDIVYEQSTTAAQQYPLDYFTYTLYHDLTNMTVGDVASGDCTPDPADFFKDNACTLIGFSCCGDGIASDGTTSAIKNSQTNFSGNNWPADPANFVLDQLKIANTYGVGTNVYSTLFDEAGAQKTEVEVIVAEGVSCGIISRNDSGNCDDFGVTDQNILVSKFSMSTPPCFVGPPSTASVSCAGDPTTCAADPLTASANVTLSYTVSTQKCYETSACTTASTTGACSGITSAVMGVNFKNLANADVTNQTSGSYSDTTTVGTTPSYTLTGVHTSAACSSCATTKVVTTTSACACGDAPEVALTTDTTRTYYEGSDISISYVIDDPDTTKANLGQIKFYYTNDITEVAQIYTVSNATELSGTDGNVTLTVKIPKAYVTEDIPIYFGIIVQDDMGLKGTYPTDFAVNGDGTLSTSLSSSITNIKSATAFAFDTCCLPYPNQFPFIPAENGNNLLQIQFALNVQSSVTMRIYTMDGRLVRQVDNNTSEIGAACTGENCNLCNWETGCQWDGTDYQGGNNLVGNGMYIVNIHAIATGDDFTGAVVDYTKGIVVMR